MASAGIHVHHIPALYEISGNDAFWLSGRAAGNKRLAPYREVREVMDLWARLRFDE